MLRSTAGLNPFMQPAPARPPFGAALFAALMLLATLAVALLLACPAVHP